MTKKEKIITILLTIPLFILGFITIFLNIFVHCDNLYVINPGSFWMFIRKMFFLLQKLFWFLEIQPMSGPLYRAILFILYCINIFILYKLMDYCVDIWLDSNKGKNNPIRFIKSFLNSIGKNYYINVILLGYLLLLITILLLPPVLEFIRLQKEVSQFYLKSIYIFLHHLPWYVSKYYQLPDEILHYRPPVYIYTEFYFHLLICLFPPVWLIGKSLWKYHWEKQRENDDKNGSLPIKSDSYLLLKKEKDNEIITEPNYVYVKLLINALDAIAGDKEYHSIALNGKWGSGKTSILKTLEQDKEIKKKYHTIWIDMWKLKKTEDVIKELESKIGEFIRESFFMPAPDVLTYFKKVTNLYGNNGLTAVTDFLASFHTQALCKYQEITEENISEALKDQKKEKLLILFDDIDRILEKNELLFLLKTIRYIAGLRKCVSITGIDFEKVSRAIVVEKQNEQKQNETHYNYVYKIFNTVIDVSEIARQYELKEYGLELLNDLKPFLVGDINKDFSICDQKEILDSIENLFKSDHIYQIFYTYRELKLTMNDFFNTLQRFNNSRSDLEISKMVNTKHLFIIIALKNIDIDFYYKFIEFGTTLLIEKDYIKSSLFPMRVRIVKFLNESLLHDNKYKDIRSQRVAQIFAGFDLQVKKEGDKLVFNDQLKGKEGETSLLSRNGFAFYIKPDFECFQFTNTEINNHISSLITGEKNADEVINGKISAIEEGATRLSNADKEKKSSYKTTEKKKVIFDYLGKVYNSLANRSEDERNIAIKNIATHLFKNLTVAKLPINDQSYIFESFIYSPMNILENASYFYFIFGDDAYIQTVINYINTNSDNFQAYSNALCKHLKEIFFYKSVDEKYTEWINSFLTLLEIFYSKIKKLLQKNKNSQVYNTIILFLIRQIQMHVEVWSKIESQSVVKQSEIINYIQQLFEAVKIEAQKEIEISWELSEEDSWKTELMKNSFIEIISEINPPNPSNIGVRTDLRDKQILQFIAQFFGKSKEDREFLKEYCIFLFDVIKGVYNEVKSGIQSPKKINDYILLLTKFHGNNEFEKIKINRAMTRYTLFGITSKDFPGDQADISSFLTLLKEKVKQYK